jgi:hypothetical protein
MWCAIPVRGKHYRLYAGIGDRFIPCEATFTNFKDRLGESLYNRIFHTLVQIAELLGFLSFKILATDGLLSANQWFFFRKILTRIVNQRPKNRFGTPPLP